MAGRLFIRDTSLIILLLIPFALTSLPPNPARAAENLKVETVESNREYMSLEIRLNPAGLFKNTKPARKKTFPPSFAKLLGIPAAAGFNVKVLDAESSFVTGEGILENTIYKKKDPERLRDSVRLVPLGWVRDQRIAKLNVNPFIMDSTTGKRIFLREFVIKIEFNNEGAAQSNIKSWDGLPDSDSFEKVLRYSIANYEHAKKYRARIHPKDVAKLKPILQPGSSYIKIGTRKEGIYRLYGKDIRETGVKLKEISPKSLRLFNFGREVPILVSNSREGSVGPEDAVTFYAVKPPEEFRKYTNENIYWLSWGGEDGKRMGSKNGDIGEALDAPFSYKSTFRGEEDREYVNPPPPVMTGDRWFWARISAEKGYPDKRYFVIPGLANIDPEKKCSIRLSLQGVTDDPKTENDHHAVISLNGHVIEDAIWSAREEFRFEGDFPSEFLVEGDNIIRVELPGDRDVFADQIFFDWFELDWWTNAAQNETLKFRYQLEGAPGICEFRCRNFRGKEIEAYDITDKLSVKKIVNLRIEQESVTDVVFQDRFGRKGEEKAYLVTRSSYVPTPERVDKVTIESDLRDPQNIADYIIITHSDFYEEVERLARYRENQALKVKVVNITDIYDQFSYGLFTSVAIKDFLRYVYDYWERPAPSYLLLVGDANWDYRDNMGYGIKNFVPTYLVAAHKNEDAASDNWFVCVSGEDILPDMHVGRFPVSTREDARNMVDKILEYEAAEGKEQWTKRVLFVADDEVPMFERHSDLILENHLPRGFESTKIYLGSLNLPKNLPLNEKIEKTNKEISPMVLDEINKGCGIVQFVGHGGLRVWSHKHILDSRKNVDHWERMDNQGKLPIVFAFTCLNGYFDSPRFPTIAERFLNEKDTGAVAFASSSRDSTAIENLFLNRAIFDSIFHFHIQLLGQVMSLAKIRAIADVKQYSFYMNTFCLFGDPALRVDLGRNF